jgi:hypothetical protein
MGAHEAQIILLSMAVLALVATAAGFVVLVWRLSWTMQGFVATELQRSKYEERIVAILHEYIELQRSTNEQLWMAVQVQADRLNRSTERKIAAGIRD